MEFKNNKITLSFCNFRNYLNSFNIEVNEELINSLCHENYTISKNKDKYICKMKYSEDRIKKANTERLKKRIKNKNNNIVDEKEIHSEDILKTELKDLSSLDNLKNEICLSPNDEYNNLDIANCKDITKSQDIQTARTSSYLFEDDNQFHKNDNININSKQDNKVNNETIDTIPDDIFDIYEELDLKDQIIEKLENNIVKLKDEINIRDKKILELIKKTDNLKINSFMINKKDIIYELNKLSLQKTKIYENVNTFIISLEKVPPKKVFIFINERITNLKKEVNDINILSNSINHKIIELLNY